jgi:ABC-type multidrug transport system fused ATPase/permease subunit
MNGLAWFMVFAVLWAIDWRIALVVFVLSLFTIKPDPKLQAKLKAEQEAKKKR